MALLELLLAHDEHNYAAASLVVVVVYALSAYVAKPGGAGVSAKGANANVDAAPETRAAFASFRRANVVAFGCGLWCEFAGAAMLFAALRETYPIVVVAELFAASFAGSWASRAFLRRAAEAALGLRGACACGLALYACSALGTAVSCDREGLYALLVASRVAAGVAQPVLQQSFEAYQRSAHAAARYPSGWRRETYEAVGFASTAASLGAGVGAEAASSTTGVCGGDAEAGGGFLEFRSVAGTGGRRGVVVTLAGACLDAAAYLALVAWAPVLARVDGDAPFGLVYSLAMAAAVIGTNGFALAASRRPPKFEALAAAACAVGAVAFAVLAYHRDDVPGAVAPFLLFQLAFGCSKPAFASLRGKHVPAESRDAAAKLSSAFVAGAGLALTLLYPGHPTAVFAACAAICGTAAPALALPAAK
ncbi:molybdate ion transmembrane transporter [Aureococcus anophagefferens]|nr:molybdate ion transmembrane transporter [Aureococcus anophagefferens]